MTVNRNGVDQGAVSKRTVTAKGNLIVGTANSVVSNLAVGNDGETLVADSTTATGLKWAAPGMSNPMTTTGDIIYSSSGSTPARRAIGTTGQVLTVSSGVPTWATPSGSSASYSLINAGGTNLSGSTTTISSISGYDKFMIVVAGAVTSNTLSEIFFRINGVSTASYFYGGAQNNYANTYGYANFDVAGGTTTNIPLVNTGSTASKNVYGYLNITGGGNSSGSKSFQSFGGVAQSNGQTQYIVGGLINIAATISSISIITGTGTFTSGTIYVYGSAN